MEKWAYLGSKIFPIKIVLFASKASLHRALCSFARRSCWYSATEAKDTIIQTAISFPDNIRLDSLSPFSDISLTVISCNLLSMSSTETWTTSSCKLQRPRGIIWKTMFPGAAKVDKSVRLEMSLRKLLTSSNQMFTKRIQKTSTPAKPPYLK